MKRLVLLTLATLAACASLPGGRARDGYVAGADGTRLYYRTAGRGADTVVVVHGFQGNNHRYLAADLLPLARGRVLVFYDQRGGGRSTAVDDTARLGIEAHVRDLEALRRGLGIERLRLLGHSGGAAVATRYAMEHPARVERMVLVAPPAPTTDFAEATGRAFSARLDSATWARLRSLQGTMRTAADPVAVCRRLVRELFPRVYFADPTSFGRMRGDFCASPPERVRTQGDRTAAFLRSLPRDWRAGLRTLAVPVLVIHGDHDALPVAGARAWVDALPGARLVVVPDADHLPWVEHPARVLGEADAFLRER